MIPYRVIFLNVWFLKLAPEASATLQYGVRSKPQYNPKLYVWLAVAWGIENHVAPRLPKVTLWMSVLDGCEDGPLSVSRLV